MAAVFDKPSLFQRSMPLFRGFDGPLAFAVFLLASAGLISRERITADRRQVVCRINEAGLALLARLDPALIRGEEEIVGGMSAEELRVLNGLLGRIRARVR